MNKAATRNSYFYNPDGTRYFAPHRKPMYIFKWPGVWYGLGLYGLVLVGRVLWNNNIAHEVFFEDESAHGHGHHGGGGGAAHGDAHDHHHAAVAVAAEVGGAGAAAAAEAAHGSSAAEAHEHHAVEGGAAGVAAAAAAEVHAAPEDTRH